MKDSKYECMAHGWRSQHQVCPFCMVMLLESDVATLRDENSTLRKQIESREGIKSE